MNVARLLATLDQPCTLTGFVGRAGADRFARSFDGLPERARQYVLFIEKRIRTPIKWISVGPRREQIIMR